MLRFYDFDEYEYMWCLLGGVIGRGVNVGRIGVEGWVGRLMMAFWRQQSPPEWN